MLAAVADFYHWPRADIETLTAPEARFWLGCAGALRERQKVEKA